MAFLDNSGDIILDAVLTDAGRKRMAEGKFNIAKYAFGDEEINYELFNNNHPSGSAFYDLQIMQTPILEAFTNNTSTMSSKLMTLNDNNFLYLPTIKLNEVWGQPAHGNGDALDKEFSQPSNNHSSTAHSGSFLVTVDSDTEDLFRYTTGAGNKVFTTSLAAYPRGVILGASPNSGINATFICVDQGIGGTQQGLSLSSDFPDELRETAYMIRIDNRLGRIIENRTAPRRFGGKAANEGPASIDADNETRTDHFTERVDAKIKEFDLMDVENAVQSYAFVDDDNIATYYITTQQTNMLIPDIKTTFNSPAGVPSNIPNGTTRADSRWKARQVFQDGPVGSRLMFSIKAQDTVAASYDLFGTNTKELWRGAYDTGLVGEGSFVVPDTTGPDAIGKITVRYIDTTVSVIGVTTGYRIDIPVRFVKKSS